MLTVEVLTDEEEGNQGQQEGDDRPQGSPRADSTADLVPDDLDDSNRIDA